MKTAKWLLLAVSTILTVVMLGGCGNKENPQLAEGKTAEEWRAKAVQNEAEASRLKAELDTKKSPTRGDTPAEAERAQKKQATNENFLTNTKEQAKAIESSKDGKIIAEAIQVGLGQVATGEVSLNRMDGHFVGEAMRKLSPINKEENFSGPEWAAVKEGRDKIRQSIIKWFVDDFKRLDLVWPAIRPVLRQKYTLLNTLRGHEKLFKTVYTQKAYAPLYECMQWHETLIYPLGDKPASTPEKKDAERCNKAFKSFGVDGVEFGVKNGDESADHANIAFDNAIWIVEFLRRREADGGEKFAQRFQKFALDYIK